MSVAFLSMMNSFSAMPFVRAFAHFAVLAGLMTHQVLVGNFIDAELIVGGYSLCALVFLFDALVLFFPKALSGLAVGAWLGDALFLAGLILAAGLPALALVAFLALLLSASLFLERKPAEALWFLTGLLIVLPLAIVWREEGALSARFYLYLSVFLYAMLSIALAFGWLFLKKAGVKAKQRDDDLEKEDLKPAPHIGLSLELSRKLKPALNTLSKYFPSTAQLNPAQSAKKPAPPRANLEYGARDLNKIKRFILNFIKYAEPEEPLEKDFLELRPLLMLLLKQLESHPQRPESLIQRSELSDQMKIQGSGPLIRQCFEHILVNSFEALKNQSQAQIHIRGRTQNRFVILEFEDNGHGIAPDEQKKIFTPFFSKRFGLRGLGLPYAQKIIKNHGGFIGIKKSAPTGTIITVRLPSVLDAKTSAAAQPLKKQKSSSAA